MAIAIINIGSNKGDRRSFIDRTVALIIAAPWSHDVKVSAIFESAPWGYSSDNDYFNVGVIFATDLSPVEVLHNLQQIERSIDPSPHRDTSGAYIDRTIDIDLIAIDDIILDTPVLTLPHPRMHQRRFVLAPMAELCPRWRHPILHKTVLDLLETDD